MLTEGPGLPVWATYFLVIPFILIVVLAFVAFGIRITKIIKQRKEYKKKEAQNE